MTLKEYSPKAIIKLAAGVIGLMYFKPVLSLSQWPFFMQLIQIFSADSERKVRRAELTVPGDHC